MVVVNQNRGQFDPFLNYSPLKDEGCKYNAMIENVTIRKLKVKFPKKQLKVIGKSTITNFNLPFLYQLVVVKILAQM